MGVGDTARAHSRPRGSAASLGRSTLRRRAIELAEKYPNVFAVVGVHPSYVEEAAEDVTTPLLELAKNSRVVALGETGLDYHRLPSASPKKTWQYSRSVPISSSTSVHVATNGSPNTSS